MDEAAATAEGGAVRRRSPGVTVLVLVMAGALALAGGVAAPDAWPSGPGTVRIELDDRVVSVPVEVGSAVPVEVRVDGIDFALPTGVGTDGAIEILVSGAGVAGAEVRLVLPDGRDEVVPVLDGESDALRAVRRPPRDAAVAVGLLAAVVVLWVSELVPLHVTALGIPVVLAATETTSASGALAPFADPVIILFLAGFLLARALSASGLDRLAAGLVVRRAGASPARLLVALAASSAFASLWMSNTAAVALLLPIALRLTAELGAPGYQRAVVLAIAYAATIGGVGSAIGTPANPLAITYLAEVTGDRLTFAEWFLVGMPLVVVLLPLMLAYLWFRLDVDVDPARLAIAHADLAPADAPATRLTASQWQVIVTFALIVAAWLSESWHGIETGIVALAGAVALMALGRIETADLGRISWPTLLTFGGGLSLGVALIDTGAADWVVTRLEGLAVLPPWLAVVAVAAVTLGVTTIASNTAAAAILIPLAIPLAGLVGVEPAVLVLAVAIASSIDFALVVGTPPTMLAYSSGLFTVGQILRIGIVLDLVGLGLASVLLPPVWDLLGVV